MVKMTIMVVKKQKNGFEPEKTILVFLLKNKCFFCVSLLDIVSKKNIFIKIKSFIKYIDKGA